MLGNWRSDAYLFFLIYLEFMLETCTATSELMKMRILALEKREKEWFNNQNSLYDFNFLTCVDKIVVVPDCIGRLMLSYYSSPNHKESAS